MRPGWLAWLAPTEGQSPRQTGRPCSHGLSPAPRRSDPKCPLSLLRSVSGTSPRSFDGSLPATLSPASPSLLEALRGPAQGWGPAGIRSGASGLVCAALQGCLSKGSQLRLPSPARTNTWQLLPGTGFGGFHKGPPSWGHTCPLAPAQGSGRPLNHPKAEGRAPAPGRRLEGRVLGPRCLIQRPETHPPRGKTCRSGRRGLLR